MTSFGRYEYDTNCQVTRVTCHVTMSKQAAVLKENNFYKCVARELVWQTFARIVCQGLSPSEDQLDSLPVSGCPRGKWEKNTSGLFWGRRDPAVGFPRVGLLELHKPASQGEI